MRRLGITGTAAMLMLLLLGAGVFEMGFAQQDNHNAPKRESAKQTRPAKQNQRSAPKTPQRQARSQPARQQPQRQARQQPRQRQQQRGRQARGQPARQRPQPQAELQLTQQQRRRQQGEQRSAWQQHRARSQSEDRNWQQRGGYNGYRVPTNYYRRHYGRGHEFRVYDLPFMEIGGYPSFQYGGYWLSLVDPIPPYWGNDWYQSDNVYVVYADNGYYLYDSNYPQEPGIAISINF